MKKGIRYLRFSNKDQSTCSIERQDMITKSWMDFNKVQIVDTFIDEGKTATTFDRPNIKELFKFIKKNHSYIDYLVVSELTRFSREVGDAINMVKKIQEAYDIKIVNASRGSVYDCSDPNLFFLLVIEFAQGNSENIKRRNDINGGIYTAKAKEGRYIHGRPPFGYNKEVHGKNKRLVINEQQAEIIKYIYNAFLRNTPEYLIKKNAKELGLTIKGNSIIHKILTNPIYTAQQHVRPWKDMPGGLFSANHQAIINLEDWQRVQNKLNKINKPKVLVSENFPLRGVLKCHCSLPLTGAPSRGRHGTWYDYYKCKKSGHLNLSAKKAHQQLREVLHYMSLPERLILAIKDNSEKMLEERLKDNKKTVLQKHQEFQKVSDQLKSIEEKWINNQITHETYSRWYTDLTQKKGNLKATISRLSQDSDQTRLLLEDELIKLSDLNCVYDNSTTVQKQELIHLVFDSSLYYFSDIYRTPYIMPVFTHNLLILKEKHLLEVDGVSAFTGENPSKWS